jgi:hypothetical protein
MRSTTSILLLAALVAGCGQKNVQVYQVEKEQSAPPGHQMQMPPGHPDTGIMPPVHPDMGAMPALPGLQWKLPEGWQEGKPSAMRAASFTVPGKDGLSADVAVIPLPPGGSDLELVNMWRSQMKLAPATAAEAEKEVTAVTVADIQAKMYDIASEATVINDKFRGRILVAIINKDGLDWFFKMSGEESLVSGQKPAFVEFLKSISFGAPSQPAMASADPHGFTSSTLSKGDASPSESSGHPAWTVPTGWQEAAAGQFLLAKFVVSGEGGAQAAINISQSAGDGGGLAANVNRWRKQLGLAEMSAEDITKSVKSMEVNGGKAELVEMNGMDARSGQPASLVGAIVPQEGQTWFYKLMGNAAVVSSQKEAFTKFVQSVKY